ncbi:MAG: ornithine--oxo-acid transaminase [Glaciecola sp.]|jgi:ornithine--oxo-acid transaminase
MSTTSAMIAAESEHCAHNYHPLPVVLTEGLGSFVTDVEGAHYLDMLAAYSALNFGHRHPMLIAAAKAQLDRLTLTSRAFHNDQLGAFCSGLAALVGKDAILPMNSGAEGVETAIKVARKWGYQKKGAQPGRAEIIVCGGNFHGRTTTIISFSDDPQARDDFGPYTPGFVTVPYGDLEALEAAINENTVGFLVEPIQGEAGVIVPPDGYLRGARELCTRHNVLLIADEIQSGMGRAGTTLAIDFHDVTADIIIMGKALGGGILALSAIAADWDVLGVIQPGEHGSTFGGNPVAAAVGLGVIDLLTPGDLQARSMSLGTAATQRLRDADLPDVVDVRGRGMWWAIEMAPGAASGREISERLLAKGVLAKDTHVTTIRFAPPLTIDEGDLDEALGKIEAAVRGQ